MPRFEIPRVRPGRNLFGGGAPWHDAILDAYGPSWATYAEGYRAAADYLVDLALTRRHERDFLVYPILFLYRQFLELSLKEIISYAEELSDSTQPNRPSHHRLDALWVRFRSAMTDVSDGTLDTAMAAVENAVMQFAALDPTSQAFRYPEDKGGVPVVHPLDRVDLTVLRDEMRNAVTAMQMLGGGLSALVDQRREFLTEGRP